jgi:hypothetical protein
VLVIESTEMVDGETVSMSIEVDHAGRGPTRGAVDRAARNADGLFQDGLDLARRSASKVATTIGALDATARPDEFEVTLAIRLDLEAGAVIAKTGAGAQLDVRMLWKRHS